MDQKEMYEAPSMLVFKVKVEGVICTCGTLNGLSPYTNGGDPFEED